MRAVRPAPIELPLPNETWITPSVLNAWRGSRRPGARWTIMQEQFADQHSVDLETCEAIKVRSKVSAREAWWPTGQPAPVYVFECPVIRRRKDGHLLVLSPAGLAKWVYPDGSISKGSMR